MKNIEDLKIQFHQNFCKINFKKNQWSYSLDFKVISGKNNIKLSKKNSRKPSIKGLKKGRSVIEVKTYNNITKKINVNVS